LRENQQIAIKVCHGWGFTGDLHAQSGDTRSLAEKDVLRVGFEPPDHVAGKTECALKRNTVLILRDNPQYPAIVGLQHAAIRSGIPLNFSHDRSLKFLKHDADNCHRIASLTGNFAQVCGIAGLNSTFY
jgi:hypothetical protein